MRIAFTGKGGSGKTTISSLFARQMAEDGYFVLALDADINQHLGDALGLQKPLVSMGLEFDEIKRFLRGSNERFDVKDMHKTTPPGYGSQLVRPRADDWFVQRYAREVHGVYVAGAGEIPDGNVGVRCYHGLNGAVELVLGYMVDTPEDIVVVDMTAGADAFSSALFTKVDALVLVVEPTLKSLSVYRQFKPHAAKYGIPLLVVGNKVEDKSDEEFITQHVGRLAACFGASRYVRQRERGLTPAFADLEEAFAEQLRYIRTEASRYGRDWNEMERRSHELHLKNVSNLSGAGAMGHIDPDFSLREAILAPSD